MQNQFAIQQEQVGAGMGTVPPNSAKALKRGVTRRSSQQIA